LRKPNNLKYGGYIEECSQLLAQVTETGFDYIVPYFIHLQRFAEEVNCAFDYDSILQLPPLDAVRIEILVKSFNQQLSQFETSFPAEIWNNGEPNANDSRSTWY
jgi:hypothetical protein